MFRNAVRSVNLKGVIMPNDFNGNGEPIEIVLETSNFYQYRIAQNFKGRELMDHTFKEVQLEGVVDNEGEPPILTIDNYRIL